MSKQHKMPLGTTEAEAVLMTLNLEEQRMYVSTLYSIAQDAIKSGCRDLKAMDLEIKHQLEEKGNASFEEWVHSGVIR